MRKFTVLFFVSLLIFLSLTALAGEISEEENALELIDVYGGTIKDIDKYLYVRAEISSSSEDVEVSNLIRGILMRDSDENTLQEVLLELSNESISITQGSEANAYATAKLYGIYLGNSANNTFESVSVQGGPTEATSEVENGDGTSRATATATGVYLDKSNGNEFTNLYLTLDGVKATASSDSGEANAHARTSGIYLDTSRNNTFQRFNIEVNSDANDSSSSGGSYSFSKSYGIYTDDSDDNVFKEGTIDGGRYGVTMADSEGNLFEDIDLDVSDFGVYAEDSDHNTFREIIQGTGNNGNPSDLIGFYLFNSDDNVVEDSVVDWGEYGIELFHAEGNGLKGNNLIGNETGVFLYSSNNTRILGSNFLRNVNHGAYLPHYDESSSEENSIQGLFIEDSKFSYSGLPIENQEADNYGCGFGLRSEATIDDVKITGSEFNHNTLVGAAFSATNFWEASSDDYIPGPKDITVSDLYIGNSHFNSNGTPGDEPLGYGHGLVVMDDSDGVTVNNSTFNENTTTGLALGNPFLYFLVDGVDGEVDKVDGEPSIYLPKLSKINISSSVIKDNGVFGLFTAADVDGMNFARSDISGSQFGIFVKPKNLSEVNFTRLNVTDSDYGILFAPRMNQNSEGSPGEYDVSLHHSSIRGNNKSGLVNKSPTTINAAINWWGSPEGPNYSKDGSLDLDYEGGGDLIVGPVAFAPWITKDPDADPDKPGVQLISPFPIYVHTVGPVPTTENDNTGYLDMAIWGAGAVPQIGQVIVPHGTWEAREPIGNHVELISVKGTTCHTCLKDIEDSKLTVNDDNVTIGKLDGYVPRGFIVKDEVVVKPGVDASTVHLNWNDIRNSVTNNGDGRLDAEYNWWGDLDPSDDVTGEVDYRPFLPEDPCTFTDYMEQHDIEDPRAAIAGRMIGSSTCSKELPSRMIVNYHLKPREAEEIVDEYGCYDVRLAMEESPDSYEGFMGELGG
ncbi:MAG: NosD domain-containing protein [Candidatus Bipolaricaulota bacterium]